MSDGKYVLMLKSCIQFTVRLVNVSDQKAPLLHYKLSHENKTNQRRAHGLQQPGMLLNDLYL